MDPILKRLKLEASTRFWRIIQIGFPLVVAIHIYGLAYTLAKLSELLEIQSLTFTQFLGQWTAGVKLKTAYSGIYLKSLERWDAVMIHLLFIAGLTVMYFYFRMRHRHSREILSRLEMIQK